jgi:hypothetical protein
MRGVHVCDLCSSWKSLHASFAGASLFLGSAEIRVFGDSVVYAAPTLVFHYVTAHQYQSPSEFVEAVCSGIAPPSPAYFERLGAAGLEWRWTTEKAGKAFRAVKMADGSVVRVAVEDDEEVG